MRKIVIFLLCIALAFCAYHTVANGFGIGESFAVSSYKEISDSSREIDSLISTLANINNVQFASSKQSLEAAVKEYKDVKEQYDELTQVAAEEDESANISLVDTYDIDFLWTTIGNYGTEEGISLKFNVVKSASSMLDSQSYTMCDLKFTVSGNYIPITDFIYDLEDDTKLGFEISDFSLAKGGDNLQATFTVKNVPINNKNLTELTTVVSSDTNLDEYGNPESNGNTVNTNTNTSTSTNTNTNTSVSNTNTVN